MDLPEGLAQLSPGFYLMLTAFAGVAAWEGMRPTSAPRVPLTLRWLNNFLWLIINSFSLRAVFPLLGVAWAAEVITHSWGLLPRLDSPLALNVAAGLLGT